MAVVRIRRVRMVERPRRTRFERLLMLRPDLARAALGPLLRVPLLRTAVLRDTIDRSYAALAREDLEMTETLYYRDDVVLHFADDVGPDYEPSYAGRAVVFAAYRRWLDEWDVMEREPFGFVDRGETLVVLGRERVRGESSGLEIERELGQVFRLRGAGVAEQWEYRSWAAALAH